MNEQEAHWMGEPGDTYTATFQLPPSELDALWLKQAGVKRSELALSTIGDLPRSTPILEVGCNCGNQLMMLASLGFSDLQGIDLNLSAVRTALTVRGLRVQQGNADHLPFPNWSFGLVFTSGVLSHLPPEQVGAAVSEIIRVSRDLIWGCEYREYNPPWPSRLWPAKYQEFFAAEGCELLGLQDLSGSVSSFLMRRPACIATK
jgi:hypothetical protein